MWKNNYLDDNFIFLTLVRKKTKTRIYNCEDIYPLWKTHKITPDNLKTCITKNIPTRVVQAARST